MADAKGQYNQALNKQITACMYTDVRPENSRCTVESDHGSARCTARQQRKSPIYAVQGQKVQLHVVAH